MSGTIEWITPEDAAKQLQVSKRRVLELASERGGSRLKSKREKNLETNHLNVMVHAGDVAALAYEREQPLPAKPRESRELSGPQYSQLPAITVQVPAPEALPLFLTLDQAARYSGLPRRVLEELAKALNARDVGKGSRGGQWRFSRAALDKFAGEQ